MAAFTSKAAGNWAASGQTTWTEVGVPGNGDTVTITHAITVTTTVVVGTSPATSTSVVTVNNNGTTTLGTLTINSGGNLTCRGQLLLSGTAGASAFVRINDGGVLEMDSSQATASVAYLFRMNGTTDFCDFGGTVGGTRPILRGNNSAMPNNGNVAATQFQFAGLGTNCKVTGSYGNMSKIGGASTAYAFSAMFANLSYCTFDSCGRWQAVTNWSTSHSFIMDNCDWTNSLSGRCLDINTQNIANSSGTRRISGCNFDLYVYLLTNTISYTNNISQYIDATGTLQTGGTGLIADSLLVLPYAASGTASGQRFDNCYVLGVNQSRNCRFATTHVTYGDTDASTYLYSNLIFDYPNLSNISYAGGPSVSSSDTGDLGQVSGGNPASSTLHTMYKCLLLPCSSGHSAESPAYSSRGLHPGSVFTGRGNTNTKLQAIKCTIHAYDGSASKGSHGVIIMAEAVGTPTAGTVPQYYDNLAWSPVTSGMPHVLAPNLVTTDVCTPAGAHHNASWNLIAQTVGSGSANGTRYYDNMSVAPGASDLVNVDPQFVDQDRCFVKWVRLLRGDLGVGTWASGKRSDETNTDEDTITFGLAEIRKRNGTGYDSRYSVSALQAYVRGGFAPRNPAYRAAASDGSTPGAVEGVFGSALIHLENSMSGSFQTMGL